MEMVRLENVSFQYDNIPLLRGVNLTIEEGDFWGIVGPNGSAKSTLLKLMLGLLKPGRGKVFLLEKPIAQFHDWSQIGYIPQNVREFNMGFPATVHEMISANLISQMGFLKRMTPQLNQKVEETLEIVGLSGLADKRIGHLSGGQQQRVFIARTLVSSPRVIFMDEPLVGVDVDSQSAFYELMEKLNRDMGITLIMVSHDIGVVSERTSRIACLGKYQVHVHDAASFNPEDYLESIYGEKTRIMYHHH
ncbi:MAG: metal ABC transporter ATP-binding protein [Bacillota bacterium]|nr:metal ABC transporter ATP-binding protein [Bacillota bacterium]MDW7676511.1 metal ABC transporter ATP-binding protein [Bacillota bacterium]